MTCYCYIVECSDGTFYTGWTTDPERRVLFCIFVEQF